jgi:hypothetical protein
VLGGDVVGELGKTDLAEEPKRFLEYYTGMSFVFTVDRGLIIETRVSFSSHCRGLK